MSRETLNTQFWKACKILRQDDNTNSLLDYVEQISWLLFLKCFEEFEAQRKAEAEYEGRNQSAILAQKYQWSTWTNPDPSKKLTGQDLLKFLYDELFPYLRNLQGNSARSVIRSLFEDAPSKMLKDGAILRDAIDAVQEITFESAEDVHTLSHLYESMLAKLGREGGMGGEFYTPRPIIEFIVQLVDPMIGQTVYDPAMGSAGFLVEAYKHMCAAKGNRILPKDEKRLQNESFYGQEKKALPYLLGCMNMILHGVFSSNLRRHNTLADDVRKFSEKDRYDVILTNPPFGGTEHDSVSANFPYPSKATSITFLQHIMKKVKRAGKVGMVIDEGVLFKNSENAYVQTKKDLLAQFNLHTIISLPAGVFANAVASGTGPKTDLLFFDRELDKAGNPVSTKEIWYYEVQAVGFSLTKTQRPIPENDLPDCLEKARRREVSDRSWIVPIEEIIRKDYDLAAVNPAGHKAVAHRSPVVIINSVFGRDSRLAEGLEEIRDTIDPDEATPIQASGQCPRVPLSEVLTEVSRREAVGNDKAYQLLGMRWYAKGLYIKEEKPGSEIKAKYVYRVEEGDIVYNRLFAWKGSFGVAGRDVANCHVSNEFPCFTVDIGKVLRGYLQWYMSQERFWRDVEMLSQGVARQSRLRLKQEQFLGLKIPLPTLEDQERIVNVCNKVSAIRDAAREMLGELDALMPSVLSSIFHAQEESA